MSLTTSQQNFLDDFATNYAAFVTALTAAAEADNDQSTTTLADAAILRQAINEIGQKLAENLGLNLGPCVFKICGGDYMYRYDDTAYMGWGSVDTVVPRPGLTI